MFGDSKIVKKMKEEPLVPLGVGLTVCALLYAAWGLHYKNIQQAQRGMRGRVIMQGLTVCALVGYGVFKTKDTSQTGQTNMRPINWDKLEREAQEAEALDLAKGNVSPAMEKLIAQAKKEREEKAKSVIAKSIFVQEVPEPKK
ncbi:Respiratory supercomplex factor 1, mitochondrial [Coemansia sp. RSA 1807]|nr:Respiratory supercomplex factor 1, mitochondrial [Coemansia sp. RSA 1591]KAJ1760719.1 Respiratory supercomplex factor 1, mitochondrial [Coemansia sp. RSA 1752]KAJ2133257.1 Respiratory supercomplex factor 1, mitochondrial [Coemansia sp. RSA 921]KAJ2144497.1 Respiratory supercomplex factor 1, mitochondrial [Coemansia sp. RSA 564]KAJ2150953.1 Respiratory supercomplex factor 1, mitochondrial [Coemansia sp. RSA 562]KAJ2155823.1 Respiratory supercomplex factor 1, mitochondrial [Coemansia sp. RSA 